VEFHAVASDRYFKEHVSTRKFDIVFLDSAPPIQHEAGEFRQWAAGVGSAWHGDVFKVMFFIHDYFSMFRYVTLERENPQPLVAKAPRENATPAFADLEAFQRHIYFDFVERQDIFNLQSESDGFSVFLESIQSMRENH
jgi:hypothetical protein